MIEVLKRNAVGWLSGLVLRLPTTVYVESGQFEQVRSVTDPAQPDDDDSLPSGSLPAVGHHEPIAGEPIEPFRHGNGVDLGPLLAADAYPAVQPHSDGATRPSFPPWRSSSSFQPHLIVPLPGRSAPEHLFFFFFIVVCSLVFQFISLMFISSFQFIS